MAHGLHYELQLLLAADHYSMNLRPSIRPQPSRPVSLRSRFALIAPFLFCLAALAVDFAIKHLPHPFVIRNSSAHASMEASGAAIGIAVALILVLLRRFQPQNSSLYLWFSSSLIPMGILDLFHSSIASADSELFVWFRGWATFAGGLLVSGIWLPRKIGEEKWAGLVPIIAGAGAILFALLSLDFESSIPPMLQNGNFTREAIWPNFLGGALFLLASVPLFQRCWNKDAPEVSFSFLGFCLSFGSAGLLFEHSRVWDPNWWWWHGVRLGGYSIAFIHIALVFRSKLQELEKAIASREEFLSIATHEVKNSLTGLYGMVQLLRRQWESQAQNTNTLSPSSRQALGSLIASSEFQTGRVVHMVGHLLDLARIRSGKLELSKETIDLGEVVQNIADRHYAQLQNAMCTLNLALERGIVGRWDRLRTEQVITNLLLNAMSHAPGSPIQLQVSRKGDVAHFVVQDDGPGIPPELQERIFQRYERARARKPGGLGLGLYITQQIVVEHGGRIHVESAPGKGTRFIVEMPLPNAKLETLSE